MLRSTIKSFPKRNFPFSIIFCNPSSASAAALAVAHDELSEPTTSSPFSPKKNEAVSKLRGDPRLGAWLSGINASEMEGIVELLRYKKPQLALEFFFLSKNKYGFKHSKTCHLIVAHVLAGKQRLRGLKFHLQEMVKEEGMPPVGEEGMPGYIGPRLILFGGATALEGNSAASGTPSSAGSAGIRSDSAPALCELLQNNFSYWVSNYMVWNMLAVSYSTSEMVSDALFVLTKMKDLNLEVSIRAYNSVLHSLTHTASFWDVYNEIKASGASQIEYRNSIFIDALCRQSLVREPGTSVGCFNSIMSSFCKMGYLDVATSFFGMMFKCGILPDVCSYSILIHGLFIDGSIEEGLKLASDMEVHSGLKPDIVMYSILIHALCKQGQVHKAVQLCKEMCLKKIIPNSFAHGSILFGLCENRSIKEARKYFDVLTNDELMDDIVLYNIMINKYVRDGDVREAGRLYKCILKRGITPSTVTFNSLIHGLCKARKVKEAREFFKNIYINGLVPSAVTYTTFMNAFCEEGNIKAVFEMLSEMEAKHIEPTCATYTVIIKSYCKLGRLQKSVQILKDMFANGLSPDEQSFNTIIHEFSQAGDMKNAFCLRNEMLRHNLQPNHVTHNILIKGLCMLWDLRDADAFFSFLQDQNMSLSKQAYTTLIKAHCAKGDAMKAMLLFQQMIESGFEVSIRDYIAVINRLCKHRLIHGAICFKRILHSRNDHDSIYQLLSLVIKCGF